MDRVHGARVNVMKGKAPLSRFRLPMGRTHFSRVRILMGWAPHPRVRVPICSIP